MKTPKRVHSLQYLYNCSNISINEWNDLMKGSTKANGSLIRNLIKKHLPDLYDSLCLDFNNPYEDQSRKKQGMFIYVHSAIEYFIKFN